MTLSLSVQATGPDGKLWVSDVEQVIRIRTGEMGPDAL